MKFACILAFSLLTVCSFGQEEQEEQVISLSGEVSGGLVMPGGKALSEAYTIGFDLGLDAVVHRGNWNASLGFGGNLFTNNPPSAPDISDNLVLYGPRLRIGYKLPLGRLHVEPFLGVGYEWGINSISNRSKGMFADNLELMNLSGFTIGPGLRIHLNDRSALGLWYRFYNPAATLTQDATNQISSSGSQLYGPTLVVPDQNLDMNKFSLTFHWRL